MSAHQLSSHGAFTLFLWDTFSAMIVFATMLITLESIVGCCLTVGATLIAYYCVPDQTLEWNGQLPSFLLSLAVITPLSQSISMGFQRREKALSALASYRSAVYNREYYLEAIAVSYTSPKFDLSLPRP